MFFNVEMGGTFFWRTSSDNRGEKHGGGTDFQGTPDGQTDHDFHRISSRVGVKTSRKILDLYFACNYNNSIVMYMEINGYFITVTNYSSVLCDGYKSNNTTPSAVRTHHNTTQEYWNKIRSNVPNSTTIRSHILSFISTFVRGIMDR